MVQVNIIKSSLKHYMESVHWTILYCEVVRNNENEEDIIDNFVHHLTEHVCVFLNEPRDKNVDTKKKNNKIGTESFRRYSFFFFLRAFDKFVGTYKRLPRDILCWNCFAEKEEKGEKHTVIVFMVTPHIRIAYTVHRGHTSIDK